jgi:Ca2+-binding RTX toxin-like protein
MTKTLIAALVAATALLAPAVTQAATVSLENGTIVYRGEGAEGNDVLVSTFQPWGDPNTYLSLSDKAEQDVLSGPCFMTTGFDPSVLCPLDPSQPLRIEGSAANDDISVFSNDVPDAKPIEMHGGAGNDTIEDVFNSTAGRVMTGGPGNDTILGHGGNDVIDGGDGNDEVDGGVGDDVVRGGAGDDEMWGDRYKEPGSDLLDGGPGTDTTEEWTIPSDLDRQPRVNVTLDGLANDGRPGENDNVVSIERLDMNIVGDFVGTDGPDQIKIVNPGNTGSSSLTGLGGDDVLVGYDFDDAVDGGAGNDTVEGGRGNDTVTGGPGRDTIYGDATSSHCSWYSCKIPFGNDTIQARDGEQDNIDCGIGTDTAIVDSADVVANCETVDGSGGGDGGGGGGGSVAFAVKGKASVRALASKGLRLAVPCPSACTVSGTLTADRKTARKVGASKIGSGKGSAKAAGTAQLKLKLAAKVKRRFKRLSKATVTVRVTVKANGAAQTGSRTLKLKR